MAEQLIAPAPGTPAPVVETPPAVLAPVPLDGSPTPVAAALPAATPPAAPEPAVPASVPALSPEVQSYIAALEQDRQAAIGQADTAAIQEAIFNLTKRYETEDGLTLEVAQKIAQREVGQVVQGYRARQALNNQIVAAFDVAEKYKVNARLLMNLPSLPAMEQEARNMTQQSAERARIAALEAEVASLKKAPVQAFASGAAAPQADTADYIQKLKSGQPLPSTAEIDRFTARYLAGNR